MDFVQPMMELLKLLGTLGAYSLAVAITAIVGIQVESVDFNPTLNQVWYYTIL